MQAVQNENLNLCTVSVLETAIGEYVNGGFSGKSLDAARAALATALATSCSISVTPKNSLESVLALLEFANAGQRTAAVLLMRALVVDGLVGIDDPGSKASRIVPAFVERSVPDIAKHLKTNDKRQNFEKLKEFQSFHGFVVSNFDIFNNLTDDLIEIKNLDANLRRPFANKLFQTYLQPFGFGAVKGKVESILDQISRLVACTDSRYKAYFDQLSDDVLELKKFCIETGSFFTAGPIAGFVEVMQRSITALENSASELFYCSVVPKRKSIKAAEKKYPLHETGRTVFFSIPMENSGPGLAVDVTAEIDCGTDSSIIVENPQQRLGDIPPGDFAILVIAYIMDSTPMVRLTIQLEWHQLFGKGDGHVFNVEIEAQNSSVDWNSLENLEPYSLEVAEGETFVGRAAKLKSIGNRLLKKPMSSTYITGQKRIGKTSLAHAAIDHARASNDRNEVHHLYLEYGEYCSFSPDMTVKTLGDEIFTFLQGYLPPGFQIPKPDFLGSLSQLNGIAKTLAAQYPEKRFVIVLDEFDEIHPEMYRLGALAETFFANLRTLASRSNLAFILVGGEKMPFIIGAQGDQLNKFVREPLDYFSRSNEWVEYCRLVTNPVAGLLNWDEAAINELFNVTNGHPYYTNLLCSKVVAIAIGERDTEIIVSDVRHALNVAVSELDTNSFAHMWKDGINAEREEAEVTELKRLRMLVAIGRAFRQNQRTAAGILSNLSAVRLPEHEGMPILEDFLRREILREHNGELRCTVQLFEKWLTEIGVNRLIASTLADDLELKLQQANDAAYVAAGEVQSLSDSWPLYRAQAVGAEAIRSWLEQVKSFQEQRLLFKILQNIRFLRSEEIEEKLKVAHSRFVLQRVGALQIEKRSDKRRDVWLTYVGGPGKSGTQYARMYAKANSISTECIMEPANIERKLREADANFIKPKAILIIDDVVGSGKTMSEGIVGLAEQCGALLVNLSIPVLAVVLISTEEGEEKIYKTIKATPFCHLELYVCEYLAPSNYAFPVIGNGIWSSQEEKDRAKSLCLRLGTELYKNPLGYAGQGLLLVMPDTCPNNSLPILHRSKQTPPNWRALFLRPTT
ncbi:MAG: AAA family ATPase [Pseudomonadota bacterium]